MLAFFVEIDGFEPTTLCLQSRCSSQLSYTPVFSFLLSVFGVGLRIVCQSFTEVNSLHPRLPAWNPSQNKLQKFKKTFERLRRWASHRQPVTEERIAKVGIFFQCASFFRIFVWFFPGNPIGRSRGIKKIYFGEAI